jgi:hypothetical protein
MVIRSAAITNTDGRLGSGLLLAGGGSLVYRAVALLVGGAGTVLQR